MTIEEAIADFEKEYGDYDWCIAKGRLGGNTIVVMATSPYSSKPFDLRVRGTSIPQAFLDLKRQIEGKNVRSS